MKTELDFDRLNQLSRTDGTNFIAYRRTLIADFLQAPNREIDELQSLQGEIDLIRISQCTPRRAIEGIVELMASRIHALQKLTTELEQLSLQNAPSENAGSPHERQAGAATMVIAQEFEKPKE